MAAESESPQKQQGLLTLLAGRFLLREEIGVGGMGSVFRAHDQLTDRQVAVKVLHRNADIQRFEHEAHILAELDHPGIVRYLAHGPLDDGRAYLAMEWLDGETLAARLARGPLTIDDSVTLLARAADALASPHARGIVHRDLKPENLMLTHGRIDGLRVLDFGVALTAFGRLTRSGGVVGTAGYMAPEQARGARDIDTRADIFALGCVLFECLAGRPAFPGQSPLAIIAKIALDEPPRLRDVLALPHELDELCFRMLSREPEARPRDAAELARLLGELRLAATRQTVSAPISRGTVSERELRTVAVLMFRGQPSSEAMTVSTQDAASSAARVLAICSESGASPEVLLDGTVVAIPHAASAAKDQAAAAAACALALRAEGVDLCIAVAIGRTQRDRRLPVGDTLARAAWLLDHAERGAIRVDDECGALLSDRFLVADGVLVGRNTSEGVRTLLGKPIPCVGRESELLAIEGCLARSVDDQAAGAVLVTAGPGLGKSRIRHELTVRLRAREDAPRLWPLRCELSFSGSPFKAARQLIAGALAVGEHATADLLSAALGRWLTTNGLAAESWHVFLAELIGSADAVATPELLGARLDPQTMRDQLRLAFQAFVQVECSQAPVVLLIEDAHWLDASSAALIGAALQEVTQGTLFVVAFTRPEGSRALADAFAGRLLQEIRLGPLPKRGAEALVRAALGNAVEPATINRLVARAAGNAFFLEELVRAEHEGAGRSTPGSVIAVLQNRFDALSPEARQTLRAASVLGADFDAPAIEVLSGLSLREVESAISELVRQELFARVPGSARLAWTFRHALVCEAANATLIDEDRTLAHRLAATYLASLPTPPAWSIAHHHERAGAADAAVDWLVRAARENAGNALPSEVLRWVERGRTLGATGASWGTLVALGAAAQEWTGDFTEARRLALEAASLEPAGSASWVDVVRIACAASCRLGDIEGAEGSAALLLEWLRRRDGDRLALVRAVSTVGFQLMARGLTTLMDSLWQAALADEVCNDPYARPYVLSIDVRRRLSRGDIAGFVRAAGQTAEAFREVGDIRRAAIQEGNVAYGLGELGCYDQAERGHQRALADLQRLGVEGPLAAIRQNLGLVLTRLGRTDDAVAELVQSLDRFVSQGHAAMSSLSRSLLAEAYELTGRRDDAIVAARQAIDEAPRRTGAEAHALAMLGWLLLRAEGSEREALEQTRRGMAILRQLGAITDGEMRLRLAHAQALHRNGETAAARSAIEEARRELLERAAKIADPEQRESFLHAVSENAGILATATEWEAEPEQPPGRGT